MDKPKTPDEKAYPSDIDRVAPDQRGYGWVMLSLLWLLNVAFSLIVRAIAPLVTPIVRDLHLSYTQMGFILGSWQLTYIGVAIIAGTIIDRWGIRKSLLAGTVTIGLSSVLRYLPEGFGGMLGAVALFGVGGPMISIGCPKTISIWFGGKSRGTALGIYLTGAWTGGILGLTLTNSVVMPLCGYSWRYTFLLLGGFAFVVALFWWLFAKEAGRSVASEDLNIIDLFGRLFRVRQVQTVLALGLLTFAIFHGVTHWLPKILEARKFSPALAGFAASLPLAAGIPSLLVVPRLVPTQWRGRFLALCALGVLVTLPLAVTTSGSVQIVALILFGIIISPFIPILTLILMETPEVGSPNMGVAGGMFFCISEIGGFTGPLIMGASVDVTGDFLAGTLFFSVLCLIFAALTLLLKTRPGDGNPSAMAG